MSAELRRYRETPAGLIAAAFGLRDGNPVAEAARAEEIRRQVCRVHDATYDALPLEVSQAQAITAARSEQPDRVITASAAEVAARMRLVDPTRPWGVVPERPSPDFTPLRAARTP